jgi:phosphate transport system protein
VSWRSLFTGGDTLDHIEEQLVGMLRLDARSVELAHRGLLDEGDVDQLRRQVSDTDHEVNLLVQEVRRQIVVHASVQERVADLPILLTYMSIVKDIERVGDYAKNILDIARARRRWPSDDELDDLRPHAEAVAGLLAVAIEVFEAQDADRAHELLRAAEAQLADYDDLVDALIVTDRPGREAVPRALYHRYLKRITAHVYNVLTALVAPLHQLDFYHEP